MKGDHLDRAREAANNGVATCAVAHALIDIAESLRLLAAADPGNVTVEKMVIHDAVR